MTTKEFYVHRRQVTAWELDAAASGYDAIYDNIDKRRRAFNPLLPDEFWCYSCNTAPDCYSVGSEDDARVPTEIMGIPVYPMFRGGKTTYHGPGQLAIVAILDAKRLRHLTDTGEKIADHINSALYTSIMEHAQDVFNQTLSYRVEDPGLYNITGAKVASTGFDVQHNFYIFNYSINYTVDLAKYAPIAVCGVRGRVMGNLMADGKINDAETFNHGEDLLQRIWRHLYADSAIYEYPDESLNNPVLLR